MLSGRGQGQALANRCQVRRLPQAMPPEPPPLALLLSAGHRGQTLSSGAQTALIEVVVTGG